MLRKQLLLSFLLLLVSGLRAEAATTVTTYTVKAGGGGNFTTIQACANAAVAGDTCIVFAGTYAETPAPPTNGSSGLPITFRANPGDCVTVTGGWNLGSHSWITVGTPGGAGCTVNGVNFTGFEITNQVSFTTMSRVIIQNNYVHNTGGRCFQNNSNVAATFNQFLRNTIEYCGGFGPGQAQAFLLGGNNNLIDGNIMRHVEDGVALYGDRNVVRNNHFGPLTNAEVGSQHPDTLESAGSSGDLALTHLIYEGNVIQDWCQSNANCHATNISDVNHIGVAYVVIRFSAGSNIGGGSWGADRNDDHQYFYNLSVTYVNQAGGSNVDLNCLTITGASASNCRFINNVVQNVVPNGQWSPVATDNGANTGLVENHNAVFNTGYSGSWKGPNVSSSSNNFSASDLFNQNPLFVAAGPTSADLHLQAGSPMIGAGGPLTNAVGAGASSAALTVVDAGFFQDSYSGIVQADWLRIGASTTVQISAINYATNVITLASAVSWNNNDPIYLYKKSDGAIVLNSGNPDIGAFPTGGQAQIPPTAPTNLLAIVN
jgi:hypothetical protein